MRRQPGWFLIGVLALAATDMPASTPAVVVNITAERAAEVVEQVVPEVEKIRGLSFKQPVPFEVIDDDEARQHILRRLDLLQVREQLNRTEQAFKLLGLIEKDVDIIETLLAALREQAGGFYDPATKKFLLLDDVPATMTHVLTAHELTHALEDQHYDLDARLAKVIHDDDRSFAHGAVHEGSAVLVMTSYMSQAVLSGVIDPDDTASTGGSLDSLPPVLTRQLLGTYILGASFLGRGNLGATLLAGFPVDDVDRAFVDGPTSSEQILHPEKYWDERDEPLQVTVPDAGALLGKRWKQIGEGVLGELTMGALVGAETPTDPATMFTRSAADWTNEAAAGWGGDRWVLWTKGNKKNRSAILLLLTRWDSEEDAKEFANALPDADRLHWRHQGADVAIVAGRVDARADALLDRLLE